MKDDTSCDISMNDENSYSRFDSNASYHSCTFNDRKRENGTTILGHELIILQDDDEKESITDDFESTTKLNWTGGGEHWLHIGAAPIPSQGNMASSQKSALEETKKSGRKGLAPTPENDKREKATSFSIMQTQESSSSQTEQMQTLIQESETQESTTMSLLAYLNQPSQEEKTNEAMPTDVRPKIELLSTDNLIPMSSSSTQYPPNNSSFLCFEEVSTPGATHTRYMTVKDMRYSSNPSKGTSQVEVNRYVVAKIHLLRANRDFTVGWKELPRRKLIVLGLGDRMRITIAPARSREEISFENRVFTNMTIVLEYRHTKVPAKQKQKYTSPTATAGKKRVDAEEIESTINHDIDYHDEKSIGEANEHPNTFCGTTPREMECKTNQSRDLILQREIDSNSRESQKPLNNDTSGERILDSNTSVAVDSTVNSQQESLRPSRIELLGRNFGFVDNTKYQADIPKEKAAENSLLSNENNSDKKNVQCNVRKESVKNIERNKQNEDCHSSNTTTLYNNTQESISDDVGKNSKEEHKADDSSTASFAHCFTQETTDPFVDNKYNGEHKSDDSSGATIHLSESQNPLIELDKKNNEEATRRKSPSKIKLGCDASKERIRDSNAHKITTNDTANIPRNIEVEDDREDGDKAPVSQLLLSMETDNEDNDDMDDDDHSDVKTHSTEGKDEASPQKFDSNKKNNEQEDTRQSKDFDSSLQMMTNERKEECNSNVAVNLTDNKTEDECDDETVLGSDVIIRKSKEEDNHEAKDIDSGVEKMANEKKENCNSEVAVDSIDKKIEDDDEVDLGTNVVVDDTINSSETRKKSNDTLSCRNGDGEEREKSVRIATKDFSEKSTSIADDLDTEVIKNRIKETPSSVAHIEKLEQSKIVRRSGRKRKSFTTSKSTKNIACDRKDRRSAVDSETLTSHAQYITKDLSPRPSRIKKQRRTLIFEDDLEAARAADKSYENRFRVAIDSKVVNILISGFEEDVMNRISKLCTTKFSNATHLRINDTIDDNITACVLPTVSNNNEEASCRTLKAIRCALLGIPMISLACVERWRKERKITIPTIFIRSLSSRVGRLTLRDCARYGVARLASARCKEPQNPSLPFQNAFVFLCGSYEKEKKKSMIELLKEGCATIITSSREASVRLKAVMNPLDRSALPQKRFVLLFGNRGKPIPKFLYEEIMTALEDCRSRKIYVVDTTWLSLSIACSQMLPPDDFKPNDGIELWERSKALPEQCT